MNETIVAIGVVAGFLGFCVWMTFQATKTDGFRNWK